jgi:cell division protein FtsL
MAGPSYWYWLLFYTFNQFNMKNIFLHLAIIWSVVTIVILYLLIFTKAFHTQGKIHIPKRFLNQNKQQNERLKRR